MSTNEKLGPSFDRLAQRLRAFQFDKNLDIQYEYLPEHSIKDILDVGILTSDLEDVQNLLLHYINEVDKVIQLVPSIISRYTFSSKTDFETGTHVTAEIIKQQVQNRLREELEYYKIELERLNEQVLAKNAELGDARFSNTGYKIKLNLNNKQIGSFFGALLNSGLIICEKSDGSTLLNKEFADFICKNFIPHSKKRGKDIEMKTSGMTNYLSECNRIDKKLISKLIMQLEELKSV